MYWYEDEVKHLEQNNSKISFEPETLFYGSSSVRMWASLYTDFESVKPVNLGFGGSTLAACVWFFDRIMKPFNPKRLIVYAGDNDLGDGRHPEEVFIFFKQLVVEANKRFGNIPCYYVSLKPSIARWNLAGQFKYGNQLISDEIAGYNNNWKFINIFDRMLDSKGVPNREYYGADGLHLTPAGYAVWKELITAAIAGNS